MRPLRIAFTARARVVPMIAGLWIALAPWLADAMPGPGQTYFVFEDLGTLSGDTSSAANSINDAKQVTGGSWKNNGQQRAFLWTPPGPSVSLNPNAYGATRINNAGQVIGHKPGLGTAFLWTPPSSMVTLGGLG